MSYPHDDTLHGHPIIEVKEFLDERHPSAYLVFNLSGNGYDVAKLNNQVSQDHARNVSVTVYVEWECVLSGLGNVV